MRHPSDPPELRGYFDHSGTAPCAARAWPICRACSPARCAAAAGRPISPTDGGERGRCAWAITAPGTVVVGAAGRPIGRLAEAVWCMLGAGT